MVAQQYSVQRRYDQTTEYVNFYNPFLVGPRTYQHSIHITIYVLFVFFFLYEDKKD